MDLFTHPDQATLLGSPLGNLGSIFLAIREIVGGRFKYFQAHDALSLSPQALICITQNALILRTSPCYTSDDLFLYDDLLKTLISRILNISFQDNESAWTQATLPVGFDSLGTRSAVQLAPSAFIASAAASSELAQQILPP